jgi:maleylpyruvate isomerase
LLEWARTGVPSYECESLDARSAAIEEGAGRPAATLVEDVRRTAAAFAEAATGMPPAAWQRVIRYTAGQEPRAEVIVPSRLAEVLIHHVDLGIGYRSADWPSEFVEDMLPRLIDGLADRAEPLPSARLDAIDTGRAFAIGVMGPETVTVGGSERELLAWVLGRSNGGNLSARPEVSFPILPSIY